MAQAPANSGHTPTNPVFVPGPVLAFETSGRLTGVALFRDGRVVSESSVDIGAGKEEFLLDLSDRALRQHGIRVQDLTRVAVSVGPGSFTGIRVGVAAAQHLAFGADLAVAPVSSHHALAMACRGCGQRLVVLTGVRKGQVFTEVGRWDGHDWQVELANASIPVDELPDRLAAFVERVPRGGDAESDREFLLSTKTSGSGVVFLGEAVPQLAERFPELFGRNCRGDGPLDLARRPAPVAVLGARESQPVLRGEEIDQLEPLYLRAADARKPRLPSGATAVAGDAAR